VYRAKQLNVNDVYHEAKNARHSTRKQNYLIAPLLYKFTQHKQNVNYYINKFEQIRRPAYSDARVTASPRCN